jgi:hypothetical protein
MATAGAALAQLRLLFLLKIIEWLRDSQANSNSLPQMLDVTSATGESPAISYFGTEVISIVTTHGSDSSTGRKMHSFEC